MSSATRSGPHGVVVGMDGSEPSLSALRWGAFIAAATGTALVVVTVWETTPAFGLSEGWGILPADDDPDAVSRAALDAAVASVFAGPAPVELDCRVLRGNTAQVLLEASAGAQMLVVGSRGHGGFASLLLGSVSAACTEHATCPVLVIHGDTPPPPLTKAIS